MLDEKLAKSLMDDFNKMVALGRQMQEIGESARLKLEAHFKPKKPGKQMPKQLQAKCDAILLNMKKKLKVRKSA